MQTIKNNHFLVNRFFLLFLLFVGIAASPIYAQSPTTDNPDSNFIKPKPIVFPTLNRIPEVVKSTSILSYSDIAKRGTVSFFSKSFKVQEDKLDRQYFINNIFDIDESDNPFALHFEGRKTKLKTPKNKEQVNVFFELFAAKKDSSKGIPQWLIFILLGILCFTSILIAIYRKEINTTFQAFFNTSSARNLYREQTSFLKLESFSSYILFAFSMGTYCFLIVQILSPYSPLKSLGSLLLCIMGVASIYFLKYIQLKIIAFILPFSQEIDFYNFTISNTNKILGFLLIPILFLLAYSSLENQSSILYFSFFLLALVYSYRTLKGLSMAGSIIILHKFHFFIYLCAVEVAPILILLKLLSIL